MAPKALSCIIATALLLGLLLARWYAGSRPSVRPAGGVGSADSAEELARLRYANSVLLQKVAAYEKEAKARTPPPPCVTVPSTKLAVDKSMLPPCQPAAASVEATSIGGAGSGVQAPGCSCEGSSSSSSSSASASASGASGGASDDTHDVTASTLLSSQSNWDWRAIVLDMMQPWMRVESSQVLSATVELLPMLSDSVRCLTMPPDAFRCLLTPSGFVRSRRSSTRP